jgi:hypothetical protein
LAVFSHVAPPNSAVVERTRRGYEGRLEMGDDLMVIDIGADVVVRRSQMAAPAKNSQRR